MNTEEQIAYKFYLMRQGNREATIQVKLFMVNKLLRLFPTLDVDKITLFFMQEKEQGRKPEYINRQIQAIKSYAKFINSDKLRSLKLFKERRGQSIRATMSDEEIEAFLRLPPVYGQYNHKQRWEVYTLFFTICAYSGMRPGEVAKLTVDNVDLGRQVFVLEVTKTRPRYVPIAPNLIPLLEEHMKNIKGQFLFAPPKTKQKSKTRFFSRESWRVAFTQRIKALGIKRPHISAYSLRHSFITRMIEEDVNIFKVQKIVGHRQLETTAIYTHLTTKDLITTIKKDRLLKTKLTPREILSDIAALIKSYGIERDPRFEFLLQEQGAGLVFALKIKEENKSLKKPVHGQPIVLYLKPSSVN
jgi:integrase/recombinase XerD